MNDRWIIRDRSADTPLAPVILPARGKALLVFSSSQKAKNYIDFFATRQNVDENDTYRVVSVSEADFRNVLREEMVPNGVLYFALDHVPDRRDHPLHQSTNYLRACEDRSQTPEKDSLI